MMVAAMDTDKLIDELFRLSLAPDGYQLTEGDRLAFHIAATTFRSIEDTLKEQDRYKLTLMT